MAGKKIELILRDDAAVPDNTKRIAQELIVNHQVGFVAGFGTTPTALAVAPLSVEAKIPQIVMAAATSVVTERSPYIVRSSFAQAQPVVIIADWAHKNGIKKVVTVVSDFAPGLRLGNFLQRRGSPASMPPTRGTISRDADGNHCAPSTGWS